MSHAVVTGLSLICPAGLTADAWAACRAGRAVGVDAGLPAPLDRLPVARLGNSPALAGPGLSEPGERSAGLALLAARDALADAGLDANVFAREATALVTASSKAGVLSALAAHRKSLGGAGDTVPDFGPPGGGAGPGELWRWGTPACVLEALARAYRPAGEVQALVTACASGLSALAAGARLIALGRADTVLVVAADATIHPLFLGSFARMGVLARWEHDPADACRPYASDRGGFVMSEGAAAVVLQAPRRAGENRKGPSVAVAGWFSGAQGGDLVRIATGQDALAGGLARLIGRVGWPADAIDWIHAHGTGTVAGDLAEARAIHAALGPAVRKTPVVSTKPVTGHMLGAAGLAQAVLTVLAIRAGIVPPTANCRQPDPACDLDCNPAGPRPADLRRAVCLATGFGGSVAGVAFQRGR